MFFSFLHQLLSAPSISKKVVLAGKLDSHPVRSSFNSFRVARDCRERNVLVILYRRRKWINSVDFDDLP